MKAGIQAIMISNESPELAFWDSLNQFTFEDF